VELTVEAFVALESQVWDALARGDAEADERLLSDDFLGVYPSGCADRSAHVGELVDGATVDGYVLSDARIMVLAPDSVLLAYRADWRRRAGGPTDAMFVTSVWCRRDGRWVNVFSQDTPAGATGATGATGPDGIAGG
jgi:hypothetical protein